MEKKVQSLCVLKKAQRSKRWGGVIQERKERLRKEPEDETKVERAGGK